MGIDLEYSDGILKIQTFLTLDSIYLDLFCILFGYMGNVDFCLQA